MTKLKPCRDCPFRSDCPLPLRKSRRIEIATSLHKDSPFHCHKTLNYSGDDDELVTQDSKLCVGSMIFLEQSRTGGMLANLSYRIQVVFGDLKIEDLSDEVPVFKSIDEFIEG